MALALGKKCICFDVRVRVARARRARPSRARERACVLTAGDRPFPDRRARARRAPRAIDPSRAGAHAAGRPARP